MRSSNRASTAGPTPASSRPWSSGSRHYWHSWHGNAGPRTPWCRSIFSPSETSWAPTWLPLCLRRPHDGIAGRRPLRPRGRRLLCDRRGFGHLGQPGDVVSVRQAHRRPRDPDRCPEFLTTGPVLAGIGLLLIRPGQGFDIATHLLPGMIVLAIGMVLTNTPLTAVNLSSVAASNSGIAAAMQNAVGRTSALTSVACVGLIAAGTLTDAQFRPAARSRSPRCCSSSALRSAV